jgi:hypothetical protein
LKKLKLIGIVLAVLVVAGYVITSVVPKPMSADLSLIGQGKPSLVLGYENYSPGGGDALVRLKQIRSEYESRLNFIVADLGTPGGRTFANRYQVVDGQAVLLAANGQPLGTLFIPADEPLLRQYLDEKLAAAE